ncbi:MAG: glucoamylase family protein [Cyclobacteriaceae bacterium]
MKYYRILLSTLCLLFVAVQAFSQLQERSSLKQFDSDDELLTDIQKKYFEYMWSGAEPSSGLARVRFYVDDPEKDKDIITVGGSGFGIAGILVGIERGFITREAGVDRIEKIVDFLKKAKRHHGMWPHWIRAYTGETVPFANPASKDNGGDVAESAFLIQSLLCVRQYLQNGNDREIGIASKIDQMWREMDWNFYRNGNDFLFWHWSPDYEWEKNFPLRGYNECLIPYILAASSPTHPVSKSVYYNGWAREGDVVHKGERYGIPFHIKHNTGEEHVGPMFWTAFSYIGFDPRGLKDELGINYWDVNVSHAKIQHAYCIENPKGFKGYGDNCWGLTAGYSVKGYSAHNTKNDRGIISPSAALASFPFSPEESMKALKYFYYELGDELMGDYGFYDSFSQTENLINKKYLANNQCQVAPMIENYRTGLLWDLFMSCQEIQEGLQKLGFRSTEAD